MTSFEPKSRALIRLNNEQQKQLHDIKEALAGEGIHFPSPKHPAIEYAPSTLVGFLIRWVADQELSSNPYDTIEQFYHMENSEKEGA